MSNIHTYRTCVCMHVYMCIYTYVLYLLYITHVRMQYTHIHIPFHYFTWIRKFPRMKEGCGIRHKHTKYTQLDITKHNKHTTESITCRLKKNQEMRI